MIGRNLRLRIEYDLVRTLDKSSNGLFVVAGCHTSYFLALRSRSLVFEVSHELSIPCQVDYSLGCVRLLACFLADNLFLFRHVFLLLELLLLKILHKNLVFFRQAGNSCGRSSKSADIRGLLRSSVKLILVISTHVKSFSLACRRYHGALRSLLLLWHVRHHLRLMSESTCWLLLFTTR